MPKQSPFHYFKTSPVIIRLAVMLYIRFPLSLRNVEDLLHERGIEVSHETVRFWWNRFGPMLAAEIWNIAFWGCGQAIGGGTLVEVVAKIDGGRPYPQRTVDHEGKVARPTCLDVSRIASSGIRNYRRYNKINSLWSGEGSTAVALPPVLAQSTFQAMLCVARRSR